MTRRVLMITVVFSLIWLNCPASFAVEKLKLGTAIRQSLQLYMPVMAGQEQAIFKRNGLEVEWLPVKGGSALVRAMAAGAINIGMGLAVTHVQAVYRRVPLMAVSDLYTINGFSVWVKTDSRFHKPADLKGAKIGVTRFGGGTHAYSRLIVKSLGLEKDVTIVSAGGMREAVASLRAGAVDAIIYTDQQMIKLKLAGEVRDFLKVMDFLPKPWLDTLVFARKDFINGQPKTVRNAVRAILEANRFIKANPGWSLAKMKAESGFSDEAARLLYQELAAGLSQDGKIDPRGLKNINDFLFEFGIVPKGKPLPLEQIYTREFTG